VRRLSEVEAAAAAAIPVAAEAPSAAAEAPSAAAAAAAADVEGCDDDVLRACQAAILAISGAQPAPCAPRPSRWVRRSRGRRSSLARDERERDESSAK